MPKDGDAMHVHDLESAERTRRRVEPHEQRDSDWQAARRAAEAGHASTVEKGAILRLQRLAGNAGVGTLVEQDETSPVLGVIGKGGGAPLPSPVRADMERGLGADFSAVRVHDDGAAAASAQAVNAKAYTVGNEVVFNRGAYQPDSADGRHTIAHELTHVIQQRSGPVDGTSTGDGVAVSDPHDRFEQEAEAKAATVGKGGAEPSAATPASAQTSPVQRAEMEEEEPVQTSAVQRAEMEEEEPVQTSAVQRAEMEEEEPVQTSAVQRAEMEEEEPVQASAVQRAEMEEEEPVQASAVQRAEMDEEDKEEAPAV